MIITIRGEIPAKTSVSPLLSQLGKLLLVVLVVVEVGVVHPLTIHLPDAPFNLATVLSADPPPPPLFPTVVGVVVGVEGGDIQ